MNQFSLDSMTPVTVTSVNVRSELHGDEHVPAADIAFKLTSSNAILSELDGALRGMLYKAAENPAAETQPELDGVPPVSDLPLLRCPKLAPIRLKHAFAGYTLTVDRGLGGASNIVIGGCGVDRFKADCREGGTVELSFRAQASGLDEATLGKLATLIGSEVEIMLEAPEEGQTPIDASKEGDWPFPRSPGAAAAETAQQSTAADDDFKNARSFEKAVKREIVKLETDGSTAELSSKGTVLPMGAPRTKRGRDATRAFLDAHAGDGAAS